LRAAVHQALKFLLAVNFDEQLAEFAQRLQRHHLTVHVGSGAAVRIYHPAQHQLALEFDGLSVEPAQRRRGQIRKTGGHLGSFRALANDLAGSAPSCHQQQSIDDDGFSGSRFAGERRHACLQLEFRAVDDDQILQMQMREHGVRRRRGCRSRRGPNAAWSAIDGSNRSPAGAAR
jgi:hypothetical protein